MVRVVKEFYGNGLFWLGINLHSGDVNHHKTCYFERFTKRPNDSVKRKFKKRAKHHFKNSTRA